MKDIVLARRYAGALFEIAKERNILDTVQNEIISFGQNLESHSGFRLFLYSQGLSQKEKIAKVEERLQDSVSSVFYNFLLVLLRKKREAVFPTIAKEFQRLVDQENKRIWATTTSAVALDEQSLAQIKSLLDQAFKSDVRINNRIDESILGGIIVSVDGKLLDGSLKSQLDKLQSQLATNKNGRT